MSYLIYQTSNYQISNLSKIFIKLLSFCVVICLLSSFAICETNISKSQHIYKSVPSTISITPYSWPLPSYTKARDLIYSGNSDTAVQFLKKEMCGLFPFGFSATNGYKIYFYYYKLLGDAYSNADEPVDAIDAYRSALAPVPYSTITNSPIPYAKCLYGLGKQFMKIDRLADADEVLSCALSLSSNNFLLSDLYLCRAIRAYNAADLKQMGINAEKSINTKPDYNWKAYHYAALSHYVNQDYINAAETWLAGVNAFISGIPIEHFVEYLDISQPYWKIFSDDDIKELYDLFQSIIIVNSHDSNNYNIISRIINEKIKLEEIFSDKFDGVEISKNIFNNNLSFDRELKEKNRWEQNNNPGIIFSNPILESNQYEHLINCALSAEKNNDYVNALKLYQKIFTNNDALSNSLICVEGYTPTFFAIIRFIDISEKKKETISRDTNRLRALSDNAVKMVMNNKTGEGINTAPEYFFNFLIAKAKLELNPEKQMETLRWARDIYPESLKTQYIDFIGEMNKKKVDNINDLKEFINALKSLPILKPKIQTWRQIEYHILKCVKYFKNVKPKELQDLITEVQFNGLEKSIFDINVGKENGESYANSKALNNPYKQLKIQCDNGNLTSKQNKKLFDFVRKYALTIPATRTHINLIKRSIEEIQYFKMFKRTNSVELTVLCDSSAWLNPKEIYLKLDYLSNAIKMNKTSENKLSNIWQATVIVPSDIQNVGFNFHKTSNSTADKTDWEYKLFIRDEGNGKMETTAFVPRDYTQEVNIECDLNNSDVYDNPYLIYANIGYSTTKADKVKMRDDGKSGDRIAGDSIYTYKIMLSPEILMTSYVFIYDDSDGRHQTINNKYKVKSDKRQITNTINNNLNNLKR